MSDAPLSVPLAPAATDAAETAPPPLKAGQVVTARAVAVLDNGGTRLALPQGTVDVPAALPLNARVTLEVQRPAPDLALRILNVEPPATGRGTPVTLTPPVAQAVLDRGIDARVSGTLSDGTLRLATAQGEIRALPQTPAPLPAGTLVRLTLGPDGQPMLRVNGQPPVTNHAALQARLPATPSAHLPPLSSSAPWPSPGATVVGHVQAADSDGVLRIATPTGTLDVKTERPLMPGTGIRLDGVADGKAMLRVMDAPRPETAMRVQILQSDALPRGGIEGRVTMATADGVARLATVQGTLLVRTTAPLAPGSVMNIEVTPQGLMLRAASDAGARPGMAQTLPVSAHLRETVMPALQASLGRQGGMAPLIANLDAAIGEELPAQVRTAATQVLAGRLAPEAAADPDALAQAVAKSGLFYEARLAAGQGPGQVTGDMKGALLLLRNMLQSWLGAEEPSGPPAEMQRPAPPLRGDAPSAQRPARPDLPDAPELMGRALLSQSEAALARQRLLQMASLPDAPEGTRPHAPAPLHFELPLSLGQQTAVAQFTVERDPEGAPEDGGESAWRVRFALDVEPLGPVHAVLGVRGGHASVTLWAERPETAAVLAEDRDALRDAMGRAELALDDVKIRQGAPARPPRDPGVFVDRRS